jgi:hypothetical protein
MQLRNIRHITIDYDKKTYCGHPRQQGGMWNFGGGEIAVMYRRAPCRYETEKDVSHSWFDGYMSRSDIVLRRSYDHGRTWRPENETIVWSNAIPLEEKQEFFSQDSAQRKVMDMSKREAMFFIGGTSMSRMDPKTKGLYNPTPQISGIFQIRSVDKGHTWERVPLVLKNAGYPPVVMLADGTHARNVGSGPIYLSLSKDHGMSWQTDWAALAMIAQDASGVGRPSYGGLLVLPGGRLQCYMLMAGQCQALCVSQSGDLVHWSPPRPIVRYGHGPWTARRWSSSTYALRTAYGGWEQRYRSPWPLRLRDGRIVVVFARREYPPSIAAIWSGNDGTTWSDEAILRDDAEGSDMGYPVVTELDDGRIFTAYYYQRQDGNAFGGTRFIGGSCFELPQCLSHRSSVCAAVVGRRRPPDMRSRPSGG